MTGSGREHALGLGLTLLLVASAIALAVPAGAMAPPTGDDSGSAPAVEDSDPLFAQTGGAITSCTVIDQPGQYHPQPTSRATGPASTSPPAT